MKRSKKDWSSFLIWLRNGISFCFTWFVVLGILLCRVRRLELLPVSLLLRLFFLVCGGVFLFCLWFSPFFFRKMRFFTRLTGFFLLFAPYEFGSFYALGLFHWAETTTAKTIVFFCTILIFYLLCLCVDSFVCARQGQQYTQRLKEFQQKKEAPAYEQP